MGATLFLASLLPLPFVVTGLAVIIRLQQRQIGSLLKRVAALEARSCYSCGTVTILTISRYDHVHD